jgi:hypothetical protein
LGEFWSVVYPKDGDLLAAESFSLGSKFDEALCCFTARFEKINEDVSRMAADK